MRILAIDPGPEKSAYVVIENGLPIEFAKLKNHELMIAMKLGQKASCKVVIEMIASYGMSVGAEVFETCVWIGRFIEVTKGNADRIFRKDVKMHLCGNTRANDSNIRQALIDRYGPGKEAAIGKKSSPGPLYGVSGDVWAALAVAVTYEDTKL